jgi:hypothetical protein
MTTRTTRLPRVGDIWLAHYPYLTPGNMEKIRPCIIIGFVGEDKVKIQKLTTRKKKQNKLFKHAKLKKTTYLSPEVINIYEYNLIRYVGHI